MNLAQKQAYYSALGIDTWVARRRLEGAPPQHLVLPLLASRAAASAAPHPTARAPKQAAQRPQKPAQNRPAANPAPSSARQLLDQWADSQVDPQADANSPAPGTAKPAPPQPRQAAAASVRDAQPKTGAMRFEIICVLHEQLLVLDDVTDTKLTPSAYNDWLKSLFFALGLGDPPANVGREDRLAWPPAAPLAKSIAQQEQRSAAAEMLQAWMQRKLAAQQRGQLPPRALLLGAAPRELLLAKGSAAVTGDIAELPLFAACPALLLPSSTRLWSEPLAKRECWQQLQTFAQATV
ncbi:MAG: hypothetical protein HKO71_01630 [Pseudomonadales bacterium]|nr:hypothetical protein [Pseudomonadales bacterium]